MGDSANRLEMVEKAFERTFGRPCTSVHSAPGRSELGGNHTDHQRGHVLACAINLDILAAASPNDTNVVKLRSEGYEPIEVDLSELEPREDEKGTSAALVRGIAARMHELGKLDRASGFDAYAVSNVPEGSGLSSSAAFEVLVGTIFNDLFCGGAFTPLQIAQIGQYAENVYFGKPCGLMDQVACAIGGVVAIDFADPDKPEVEKLKLDFSREGYGLCIIDSHASHADLTEEYASIPNEMTSVAKMLGHDTLSTLPEGEFMNALPAIREKLGDRAALRAMHFYADDKRAQAEAVALREGDFDRFLKLVRESGRSSAMYLQNIYPAGQTEDQSLMVALALAEKLLDGEGAVRVHGGGFGGCVQAYVPLDKLDGFKREIEKVLGAESCHVLGVRATGGEQVEKDGGL